MPSKPKPATKRAAATRATSGDVAVEQPPDTWAIAREVLGQHVAEPRSRVRQSWHRVAAALSQGDEAAAAWKLIGGDKGRVLMVAEAARQSLEAAVAEARRLTRKEERAALKRVHALALQLNNAIRSSPLPPGLVFLHEFTLTAGEKSPVEIEIGWHSLRAESQDGGYPLAVCAVLEWAAAASKHHLEHLPARAVTRRKGEPERTAFVRHLARHFRTYMFRGDEKPAAIARIATAIFGGLDDPITDRQVAAMLKDRPAAFKAPEA